jgi:hypothetical protein
VRTLFLPFFAWSAWVHTATVVGGKNDEGAALASVQLVGVAQSATVEAGKTGEGAALASFRLVGEVSASHCGGGHKT